MGRPDGGPFDETPPRFIGSTPAAGAVNTKKSKIVLDFDEFIKLEKASEKVVVSPPQLQQPEIKPGGKRITVNLLDSLKPNTTYTIDFSDAIVDNNEGNPLHLFGYRRNSDRHPINRKYDICPVQSHESWSVHDYRYELHDQKEVW